MNKIDKVLSEIDGNGWMDYHKMFKYARKQRLWMFIGARRIGKTWLGTRTVCDLWQKARTSSVWVRNYKEHMKKPQFYANFLNSAKSQGWCPEEWDCRPDGIYESKDKDACQICMFVSLNTYSEFRGNYYNNRVIIVDEFIDERRKYPADALKGLLSITQTILEGDPTARLIMFSNFVSCANPYFVGLKLYPKKELDVTVFKDRSAAVEVCRGYNQAPIKKDQWGMLYKAAGYSDYAEDDEDRLLSLVQPTPKGGKQEHIVIVTEAGMYSCWMKDNLYHWRAVDTFNPANDQRFTGVTMLLENGVLSLKYCKKFLDDGVNSNVFRYDNPNTMYEIMSLVLTAV